ncbi:choloylglycine hydrolase [Alkalihalobacillus xiaoxiensis]|uniref:Choloylglycine hydrolase n=1 Tax=Shouchella xiaoxiensis TaxID=766895 RepID=A0ABS2SWB0_9BACI|nr:choloylglycine hydrolase family protein [Shouchella xiaoxiensis]MBM7839824.1 choloylglycine hydrolase [Shouchella xiaoxiensis]
MCTSITVNTKEGEHFLARNFDFYDLPSDYSVYVIPSKYRWVNAQENRYITGRYGAVGMGIETEGIFGLFDGMNEHGLMGVIHYLEGFAEFPTQKRRNQLNLAAIHYLLFALTHYRTTDELVQDLGNLNLLAVDLELTEGPPPIHWIFSDRAGKTIVIENTKDGLRVFNNPVGAFSNSPDFRWHLINLNQYTSLTTIQSEEDVVWGNYHLVRSPEMISGNFGIPGDYSSPSRFVRAAFLRNHIDEAVTELDGLQNTMKVLDYCTVARGADIEEGSPSYTLYSAAMCANSLIYYYHPYANNQISAVKLLEEDLTGEELIQYPVSQEQAIHFQN